MGAHLAASHRKKKTGTVWAGRWDGSRVMVLQGDPLGAHPPGGGPPVVV
jgi:hypothetical protein